MRKLIELKRIQSGLVILAILTGAIGFGCNSAGYKKPITKFRDASSVVVEGARVYVSELNKVERERYIIEQTAKRAQIDPQAMIDRQVFSEEGLQARMDALDALSSYGDLLLKLASSDAPEKATAHAKSLGDALTNLTTTAGKLTNNSDVKFIGAIGPVTTIIGVVIEAVIQKKIKEGLNKAILGGVEPINNLIVIIGEDLRSAYVGQVRRFSRERIALIDSYNEIFELYKAELDKGESADRQKLQSLAAKMEAQAAVLQSFENKWEALGNSNPNAPLAAMAKAHTALINFARSKQTISDFQSLVDSIEFFAVRAEQFGTAVRALRELTD